MKTLTVTYHHGHNYGALLQAYALQKTIQRLGHENEILEYPYNTKNFIKIDYKKPMSTARSLYLNSLALIRRRHLEKLDDTFMDFKARRMQMTRTYESVDDLKKDPPISDVYIVGSDQVWNMKTNPDFIPARFLDFGSPEIRRCSYAASLEQLDYTDVEKTYVKDKLKEFSSISLREDSAKNYITEITGRSDIIRMPDPVFLIEANKWSELKSDCDIRGGYILTYQVQRHSRMQNICNALKSELGIPVISICIGPNKWIKSDCTVFDTSPEEFLGLYANASVVVSCSFHGTAFGLLFDKPTYGLIRKNHANRISELMERFQCRSFCLDEETPRPDITTFPSDLSKVREKERLQGIEYLRSQLCVNL